jgi:transposase
VADAALRDLARAREDPRSALKSATCRATWGPAHLRWLSDVVCATPAPPIVFHEYLRAIHEHTERLQRLDQERQNQVTSWRVPLGVEALQVWRGVPCIVAVTLMAAIGDRTRFESPRALMTCLGRLPSAYTSTARRRQGSMTNAGNTHAHRALVDGA